MGQRSSGEKQRSANPVSGKKAILFHEVSGQDVIECLNANTGETIWTNRYTTSFVDSFGSGGGPRATPAIVDGKVYTMGAQGIVVCTDMANGKTVWKVDTQKTYRAPDGFFGMACSPLIEGNAVLLNIGGTGGAGIVALDKTNGKLLWKSLDDEASYSSPVISTLQGKRRAVFFTRTGLAVVNPADGAVDYQHRWRARIHASVNAAAPLVVANQIFLTSSYNTGALALDRHAGRLQGGVVQRHESLEPVRERDAQGWFSLRHTRAGGRPAGAGTALCRTGHRQGALE